MDKRVEGRSVTTRSGTSGVMQGRSPAVNVINITRRPDGGIVNVEMKRQEGLNQEVGSRPFATAGLPSRGAVPINVYRQPLYVTDQQSNMISIQPPRKNSPNMSAQLHSVDGHLDWSDQYQRLVTAPQRVPVFQHVVSRSSVLSDQQRVASSSNHAVRPVVEQHVLHSQVNDAVLSQHATHVFPASDVRLTPASIATAVQPSMPVRMEGTNGGIWPAQIGNDTPASSAVSARVMLDPRSGNVAPQLISRLPGLQYDVIPPRSDGPSEAERKVAELTQQLENEMRLTTSQGSSLRQQMTDSFSQYRSPPPYYGPHITANTKIATPSNPVSNCVTVTGGDSDLAAKKAGDVGVRQVVTSLSSGPADVEQPQPTPSVRQGSADLEVVTECYGKPVLVFITVPVVT